MISNRNKTEFQKKLMNETSIRKYKILCFNIIKENEELVKSLDVFDIKHNDYEKFIEDYFFREQIFLFKLEAFIINDNGVTKLKQEKFFKDEIQKVVDFKLIDYDFEKKFNSLNTNIENHIHRIQEFKF